MYASNKIFGLVNEKIVVDHFSILDNVSFTSHDDMDWIISINQLAFQWADRHAV